VNRYRIEVARSALKAIAVLPRKDQLRVRAAIDLLADNPHPPGCVALAGEPHAYRVRTGDYCIVYAVFDDRLLVQVVRAGHRRDIYRGEAAGVAELVVLPSEDFDELTVDLGESGVEHARGWVGHPSPAQRTEDQTKARPG
jgi:mRNA interferase RelE/StbE